MHAPAIHLAPRLSRRTLLRAAGVALALPLLEAMCPRAAADEGAAKAGPPRRFVGMMTNMGIQAEFFFPQQPGLDYAATPYLDLLKDHRRDLTVFSGVSLPGVDGGHAAERSFLTAAPGASRGSFRNSISLDQLLAERLGGETRFPSLVLMIGAEEMSVSYTRSGAMIPPLRSPTKLFAQLFTETTPEGRIEAHRRLQADRSLLDGLRERAKGLERAVGARDRERLDQYLTSVRDLERRLAAAEGWVDTPRPAVPGKPPEEIGAQQLDASTVAMLDLVRLALVTDSTRIVSLALNTGSVVPKDIPGVQTMVHGLTHHGNRPAEVAELRQVEEAHFRALAGFLAGLRAAQEPGGTVLDRTAVLFGTNMGSANAHSNDNLPALLAGGGFKHAGHLAFDRQKNYPLTNLYLSILHRMGLEEERFVSSTGTMRGLEMT